jgi:hypothetical protein
MASGRSYWMLMAALTVLLAVAGAAVVAALLQDPRRNGWAVALFALGTLCGAAWDRRPRRPRR